MVKRSTAVLATLAVLVLPGGSLIVGAVWLYRYARAAAIRRQKKSFHLLWMRRSVSVEEQLEPFVRGDESKVFVETHRVPA